MVTQRVGTWEERSCECQETGPDTSVGFLYITQHWCFPQVSHFQLPHPTQLKTLLGVPLFNIPSIVLFASPQPPVFNYQDHSERHTVFRNTGKCKHNDTQAFQVLSWLQPSFPSHLCSSQQWPLPSTGSVTHLSHFSSKCYPAMPVTLSPMKSILILPHILYIQANPFARLLFPF